MDITSDGRIDVVEVLEEKIPESKTVPAKKKMKKIADPVPVNDKIFLSL